jgi:uncharacterized membrane protein
MSKLFGFSLCALLAVSACNFTNVKNDGAGDQTFAQHSGSASFDSINAAIITPKCLGCHATRAPVLSSYEAVVASIGDIQDSVLVKHTMPRSAPLSADLQAMLRDWIVAGTPREGTEPSIPTVPTAPSPSTPGPRVPYNFANLKIDVLGKCVTCHTAGNPDGLAAFDTYPELMSVQEWLAPLLAGQIDGQPIPADSQMPPPNYPQLTASEKALFELWIGDGYRDEKGIPVPEPSPIPSPTPAPSSTTSV